MFSSLIEWPCIFRLVKVPSISIKDGGILKEIGLPTTQVENCKEPNNSEWQWANLNLVKETRTQAQPRMASYQQWVARYFNSWVKSKAFRLWDLVLRKVKVFKPTQQEQIVSKLGGPLLSQSTSTRAYKLEDLNGSEIPWTWNARNLHIYYQ